MADNVELNVGSGGAIIATDDVGDAQHQYVKLEFGGDGTATKVSAADPLPVTAAITGTAAVTQSGTWTVQPGNTANTTAWLVTGTGGTFPVTHDTLGNAASFDFDSGAGTDTTPAYGIAVAASGGAAAVTGDTTNGLDVDVTRVQGTVAVTQSGTWDIGTVTTVSTVTSLTQFNGNAITTNSGVVGAGVLRVVLATDVALPAGTNAIGKLAANSGVDIGDVDVTSVVPGTGATNLGKAIDTATGATDTGVLALATRDDALSALTPIEGDNIQLRVDANGALWTHDDALDAALSGSELQVDVVAALPAGTNAIGKLAANSGVDIGDVDILSIAAGDNNIGNVDVLSVIPGVGATNLGKAIDTATGATDTGVLVLATRDDALGALTPIEGDNVQLRTDANGALWTHDDALEAALAGSELQVDVVAALPAGTNAIGKLAANSGVDIGDVDVTSVVPGTAATNLGKAEDAAHTTADTGVYALAVRDDALAAHSGTDGDYESLHTDKDGALWVNQSNVVTSERVSNTDGASTAFSTFGATASIKNYITAISVFRTDAGTTTAYVDFRDGTAGSVLWSMPLPPNGGSVIASPKALFNTSANTALAFDVSAALTTIYISVSGVRHA